MANGSDKDHLYRLYRARSDSDGQTQVSASEVEQLAAMLSLFPATIGVVDPAGRFQQVTATDDKAHYLGRSLFELLHPHHHELLERRLGQVLALGEPVAIEVRASDDATDAGWYRIRLSPVAGGAIAIIARIDREREARIESKRFRALIDQADEAIFVVDPRSTRFVDVNDTACQMLRYTRAELLELGPKDIEVDFPLHSREQWTDYIIEVMAVGTLPYEGVHRRKDGVTFPVEATWSIKPFEGDEYLLGVCRDITEARRIKDDLRHAEESLRVSDRLITVGTLSAGIAHEINNPLSYVAGNIEYSIDLLRASVTKNPNQNHEDILEALGEARHGAARMSRIVRDLRTFSRRDDDSTGAVAVNDVLDSSINIAMNEIRLRAQIERDFAADVLVMANEPRLGQVFLNILINAAQAIKLGDSRGQRIAVRTSRDGADGVLVEISDTGSGMSDEVKERIFEPFFTTKPIGVGTGLGLAICGKIIEGLGGTISVTSQLGQGTTFHIRLPAAAPNARPASPAPSVETEKTDGRILIIDDDEHAAKALRRYLSRHECTITTNGHDGLRRFLEADFDVAFCELSMPDFGGLDFYETVGQQDAERVSRIVLVASGPLDQRTYEFLQAEGAASINKPYDAAQVHQLVQDKLS